MPPGQSPTTLTTLPQLDPSMPQIVHFEFEAELMADDLMIFPGQQLPWHDFVKALRNNSLCECGLSCSSWLLRFDAGVLGLGRGGVFGVRCMRLWAMRLLPWAVRCLSTAHVSASGVCQSHAICIKPCGLHVCLESCHMHALSPCHVCYC